MSIRLLALPMDLVPAVELTEKTFQFPGHPEWELDPAEQKQFADAIRRIRCMWPVVWVLQGVSPSMRDLLRGFVREGSGVVAGFSSSATVFRSCSGVVAGLTISATVFMLAAVLAITVASRSSVLGLSARRPIKSRFVSASSAIAVLTLVSISSSLRSPCARSDCTNERLSECSSTSSFISTTAG